MAGNTRDQSIPAPPQYSAPPDNTEITAMLAQIMEELKAMRSDLNTVTAEMEALKSTLKPAATQYSTPPAPQEAQKEEDKQLLQQAIVKGDTESTAEKQEPLYQATVEDIAESTAEKETEQQHGSSDPGSTKPDSSSTLSTIPRR